MEDGSAHAGTTGRLLRLLSLLQSKREWSGAELAARLGVTDRTIRRDVDRLRALDYPVAGTTGISGGYRLVSGANLPPLLLDDDEAVAIAIGLATAADGSMPGMADSAMRALATLEQVLPARLRPRLAAFGDTASAVPHPDAPPTDPTVLAVLAAASREGEIITFDYRDRAGDSTFRRVEPHGLVSLRGRWYLIAYDPDRADWRTFRVDRIDRPLRTHRRAPDRRLPAPDAATYLTRSLARAGYRYEATVTLDLPPAEVRAGIEHLVPSYTPIEPADPGTRVRLTADSPVLITQYVAALCTLATPTEVDIPAALRPHLTALATRLQGLAEIA